MVRKINRTDLDTSVSDATDKREAGEGGEGVRAVDPHQLQSPESLIAEAEALEAGGEGSGGPQAGPQAGDDAASAEEAAEGVADLLEFVREAADPLAVDLGYLRAGQLPAIWNRPALLKIAKPLVKIMDRHGVGIAEVLDRFGPYAMLAVGIGLPTLATVRTLRENRSTVEADAGQQ